MAYSKSLALISPPKLGKLSTPMVLPVMAGCIHPLTDHWHLLVPDPLDPLEDALRLLKTPPIRDGVDHDETVPLCHVLCGEVINSLT